MMQVKDYDAALDLELDSMEKFILQCLAFYQVIYCSARLISSDCLTNFTFHLSITALLLIYNCIHVTNKFKVITNVIIYVISVVFGFTQQVSAISRVGYSF